MVETHLLGADMDLYGRSVGLGFVQRVRDERRFDSVEQLHGADRLGRAEDAHAV